MKDWAPMIATLASIAAIIAGLYGVVTRPILLAIQAQKEAIVATIQAQMTEMEARLVKRIESLERRSHGDNRGQDSDI
jgi:hypothetical protein